MKWQEQSEKLLIQQKAIPKGCAIIFLVGFGAMLLIGSSGYLILSQYKPELEVGLLPFLLMIFAVVLFGAAYKQKDHDESSLVIIDPENTDIKFFKGRNRQKPTSIDYASIKYIRLIKALSKNHNTDSSTHHTAYQIFLSLNDVTQFWVDTFHGPDQLSKHVNIITKYLPISVKDETESENDLSVTRENNFTDAQEKQPLSASRFVKTKMTKSGDELTVVKNTPFIDRLLTSLVLLFVAGLPTVFVTEESPLWVNIFVVVFMLIVLSIFIGAILAASKRYTLIVDSKQNLTVIVKYLINNKKKGIDITIPKGCVKEIRANRLDGGHFWLSCALQNMELSAMQQIAYGLGVFSKSKVRKIDEDDSVIGLWEIPAQQKYTQGASFSDLIFIKNWLTEKLDVTSVS